MDQKPMLMLDIDGVLNLFGGRGTADMPLVQSTDIHIAGSFVVRVPEGTLSRIERLSEWFDIHWFTMWNENAERSFAPVVGLPFFPYLKVDWFAGENVLRERHPENWRDVSRVLWTAKTPLVPGHANGRPFIWVDDDTTLVDTAWLRQHPDVNENFMIITVDPWEGLTENTVRQAIAWATQTVEATT